MSLVIKVKGEYAPTDSKKLYRDAIVDEGTLLWHDFSNRGTLNGAPFVNGNIIYDLARDNSELLGITNTAPLTVVPTANPILTSGKGVDIPSISQGSSIPVRGINLGDDLPDYIYNNPDERYLWTVWIRRIDPIPVHGMFMGTSGELDRGSFMHARLSATGEVSMMFADATSGSIPISTTEVIQISVEFQGAGLPLRVFVNGVFLRESASNAIGFISPAENPLYIGGIDSRISNVIYYRGGIIDVNKSSLSADEIVKKDWEYCNAIGEYAGLPTKRPFIDTL